MKVTLQTHGPLFQVSRNKLTLQKHGPLFQVSHP